MTGDVPMIALIPAAVVVLACSRATIPPPRPASSPQMAYESVDFPDGTTRMRWGWWEPAGVFRWRECDQTIHDVHLGTPLPHLWLRYCSPAVCRPDPPGAFP